MSGMGTHRVKFIGYVAGSGGDIEFAMTPEGEQTAMERVATLQKNAAAFMSGWFAFGGVVIQPREFAAFCIYAEAVDPDFDSQPASQNLTTSSREVGARRRPPAGGSVA